jgi:hypothetical protein
MIDMEEFHSAFSVWQSQRFVRHPHYDMAGDFVFMPSLTPSASTVYEFMHEWTHSMLASGLHGQVVLNLNCMTSNVADVIFAYFDGMLESTIPEQRFPHKFPTREALVQLDASRSRLLNEWTEVRKILEFDVALTVFDELNHRRKRLIENWHDLHEGVASHTVMSLCLSQLDDPKDWVGSVKRYLKDIVAGDFGNDLVKELSEIGKFEQLRLERDVIPDEYARGLRAAIRICAPGPEFDVVWAGILAAMNFQYTGTKLLDMPRSEFEAWLADYAVRFDRLSCHVPLLNELNQEMESRNGRREELMLEALRIAEGHEHEVALTRGALGKWFREEFWSSALFGRFLDAVGVDIDEDSEELETQITADRTLDFRLLHFENPNVIDEHGTIVTNRDNHDAVQRGFLRSFNITRTEKLLAWFRAENTSSY